MEFCHKCMVRADPPPPVMVKYHKMTVFLGPFPYIYIYDFFSFGTLGGIF